jgi:hypothetical protein
MQPFQGFGINPMEYREDVICRLTWRNAQKLRELLLYRWQKSRKIERNYGFKDRQKIKWFEAPLLR